MARLKRLVVPGLAHHVVQRTVVGQDGFRDLPDHLLFKAALQRSSSECRVALHAYALLPKGFQLLVTSKAEGDLGRMMQALSRFYVPAFNRRYERSGPLWQGRFRAAPVGGSQALLTCMLFIEQAPQREAGAGPVDYAWSSAAAHIGARADPMLSSVPAESAYWALGNTPFEREAAYAQLLDRPLPAADIAGVEATTLKGWALGSGEFIASLSENAVRRITVAARGRPKKR
jgi:putative transposase